MVKLYFKSQLINASLIFSAFLLMVHSSACGQNHTANQNWLQAEKTAEQTTVLLNNEAGLIPLSKLEDLNIASINFDAIQNTVFDSLLNKYHKADLIFGNSYLAGNSLSTLIDDLKFYNTLIIRLNETDVKEQGIIDFIVETEKNRKVIVAYFGNGKLLGNLDKIKSPVIWNSEFSSAAASYLAQAIYGGVALKNLLKQNYSPKFLAGKGFAVTKIRLKYTVPEEVGLNIADLDKIDAIAKEAIAEKATPSAVVMVVKDGNVIFNRAYGNHTYDTSQQPTQITDIYDLASCTKTSATTMAVMQLVDQKKLVLDSTLSTYLARAKATDKKDIKVKEVMLHQAGFTPYIPFYEKLKPQDYSRDSSAIYPTKVADDYYLRRNYYQNVMWPQMLNSKVITRGKYVYSDLSMYFMKEIVESITHEKLDQYVLSQFYKPLGMQFTGYNPRNRFSKEQIVPTENDTYFRKTLLQGYVHDQGAAMAGGVSGHAGLFADANDLAILYQMVLNRGTYGGTSYLSPATVDLFTSRQSDVSRRGIGFDRWDPEVSKHYPSEFASPQTYGHTGYTGTCIWVDPKYNLIYIFLSNRVYPQVTDKLSHLSIRPRIQDAIYDAIRKASKLN